MDRSLPFASIKGFIDTNRPIIAGLTSTGSSGHMVLIVGYSEDTAGQKVIYRDPYNATRYSVSYDNFCNYALDGTYEWNCTADWDTTWSY